MVKAIVPRGTRPSGHHLLYPNGVLVAIKRAYQKAVEQSVQNAKCLVILGGRFYEGRTIESLGQAQCFIKLYFA